MNENGLAPEPAGDTAGRHCHCCAPQGRSAEPATDAAAAPVELNAIAAPPSASPTHAIEQIELPGGLFLMGDPFGDGFHGDGETPVHPVRLSPFTIDATSVTNADFARFVDATGYRTEAERFGSSAVFHLVAAPAGDDEVAGSSAEAPWWLGVAGADWRHPEGRRSNVFATGDGRDDHPVVHVSWNDAQAYCAWAGRRLPTEAEWEFASRGGLPGRRYPWGDELFAAEAPAEAPAWQVNIWQGPFPHLNTMDDGHLTTAPVRSFLPNAYGLWQTVGNVWEWCEDRFSTQTYAADAPAGVVVDPAGPGGPHVASAGSELRVMRGGSYLCHDSYCNRYRNAARSSNTPDASMGNAGFRTVAL